MQMILICDFCKVFEFCAILLHVLDSSIAKHLSGNRTLGQTYAIDDYKINKSNISNTIPFYV